MTLIIFQEKEAGINLLRSKVSKEKSGGDREKSKHQLSGHINFFQELEDQVLYI